MQLEKNQSLCLIVGVIITFVVHVQSDESTSGVCTRPVATKTSKTIQYTTMCKKQVHTCHGLWIFRWCRDNTVYRECMKNRTVDETQYRLKQYCCPGFFRNESVDEGLQCIEGCSNNNYGHNCSYKCNCPTNAYEQCNFHDGTCVCKEGWTGVNCSIECPKGYFGSNCSSVCSCQNISSCDPVNGSCNCTDPGWTGIYCDQECLLGTYGYNCSNTCSCNVNETCDRRTGECACKGGLTGINCTKVCSNGTYGRDCSNVCNCDKDGTNSCDPVNGLCYCRPGKTGIKCEYECNFGTYGDGCKKNCSCNSDQEYCRPLDGRCLSMCFCARSGTENCDENYDDCTCKQPSSQQCNSTNFFHDRFHMNNETIVDTCACKKTSGAVCVPNNGTCICKPGYTGQWCSDSKIGTNLVVSSPETTAAKSSGKDNKTVIIGSVIGSVTVVVVIVIIVVLVLFRKTTCKKQEEKPGSVTDPVFSDSLNTNDQLYEKAKVPKTHDKPKVPKTHDKAKLSESYEKAKVSPTYDKAKIPATYEKAKVPQSQTYEMANMPKTKQMANKKTYMNSAFKTDVDSADDLYNKLNHRNTSSESMYHSNDNQSNMYGHLNTSYTDQDGDYDVMIHNQRSYTADDTYDHTARTDNMYDSAVHNK